MGVHTECTKMRVVRRTGRCLEYNEARPHMCCAHPSRLSPRYVDSVLTPLMLGVEVCRVERSCVASEASISACGVVIV